MRRIERKLVDLALESSVAMLGGDAGADGLAEVLCAVHAAFFGEADPEVRAQMVDDARAALRRQTHRDASGAQLYGKGHRPVPLAIGGRPVNRGRYIKDRAERALARGDSREQIAHDVAEAAWFAWPLPREAVATIANDEAVASAIASGNSDRIARAALRAAGVPVSRNLFSADAQKKRRSKL
jgi:hypothetical protein